MIGSRGSSLRFRGGHHLDQSLHHVIENARAVLNGPNHFTLFGCQVRFETELRHSHDGVHPGAELVSEPRDEFLFWLTQQLSLRCSAGIEARERAVNEALTVDYGLFIGYGEARA